MSEGLELLLLFSIIYLVECAQWVPREAVGFSTLWPGRWGRRRPWKPSSRWRRGAVCGAPWPPLSAPLVAEGLPLQIGPSGIVPAPSSGETAPALVPWERVRGARLVERSIEIEGKVVAQAATRRLAASLCASLRDIAGARDRLRPKKIGTLLDSCFDSLIIGPRLESFRHETRWLRAAQNVLWAAVFVGLPLLLWTPLAYLWAPLLGLVLLGWVATAVSFRLTLRHLSAIEREHWPDRLHRVLVLLSPISAMRAQDLLARELLGDLDPLVVAEGLLPDDAFREMARVRLVDLEAQRKTGGGDAAWMAGQLMERVEHLLEARALRAEELLAAPAPDDERCRAFCPRCRTQYYEGEVCANGECRQLELIPFERTDALGGSVPSAGSEARGVSHHAAEEAAQTEVGGRDE